MWSLFPIEAPEDKLDRLVFTRTIRVTEEGFAVFCHICKVMFPIPETRWESWPDDFFDWFHDTHIPECATQKLDAEEQDKWH